MPIFLISLKAGGTGLNLTAADTVIHMTRGGTRRWRPGDRPRPPHRPGQAVFVYKLVATGTVEEKMDELRARKRALVDSLFDREGKIAAALTEE